MFACLESGFNTRRSRVRCGCRLLLALAALAASQRDLSAAEIRSSPGVVVSRKAGYEVVHQRCPDCGRFHSLSRQCPCDAPTPNGGRIAPGSPGTTGPGTTAPGGTQGVPPTEPQSQDQAGASDAGSRNQGNNDIPSAPGSNNLMDTGGTSSGTGLASAGQSAAPYMMGDLLGLGNTTIVVPVLTAPGIPFPQAVNPTEFPIVPQDTPVPAQLPNGSSGQAQFTSPNNPPQFPPRVFTSTNSNVTITGDGQSVPVNVPPGYNSDAQAYLISQHPAGQVLQTGQTASGGGTAQLINSGSGAPAAVLATPAGSTPRPISTDDYFNLRTNYLYTPNVYYSPATPTVIEAPTSGAQLVGITKIAENTSPLPRDRVFFNYSLFTGTRLAPGGFDVNRFVPGFEKTFFDQRASIEMRFPFAATVSPDLTQSTSGITNSSAMVFGNMSVVYKEYLRRTDTFVASWGLQTALPTAPSLNVSLTDGRKLVAVDNNSVHLMPFLGALYTPNDRFFAQGFFQLDVDANGNPVYVNPSLDRLSFAGRLHDATLMFFDFNAGYWTYRGNSSRLTGFAPTIEFHYNQTVAESRAVSAGGFTIGNNFSQISNQSFTIGCYLEFDQNTMLAVGYTAPVGNFADQPFNGELRAFLTHRFGPSNRQSRVGF